MKIKIPDATELSIKFLNNLGLTQEESEFITQNIVDAELSGRKTHGFLRLLSFIKYFEGKKLNIDPLNIDVINETPVSLYIDGHNKLGYGLIYKSLESAFNKVKTSKIVTVGIKDLNNTGYIGAYATKATEKDLIFISFSNSSGGLVPYGSKKAIWGINPVAIGVPTNNIPVILDMSSAQITWGDLMVAKNEGKQIKEGAAIDSDGNPTTDPEKAMLGGLLPFFGQKGSGMAFMVELLAGALTGSRVGSSVPGDWGMFYILIDPTLFRPIFDFKKDIDTAINELKNSPKSVGFSEIYFAGEQSAKLKLSRTTEGFIEVNDSILEQIKNNS